MKLTRVVPWGRSLEEYQKFFLLTENDLKKSILGCGDGPASFNVEFTEIGGNVISVDPIYHFTAEQIKTRIKEVYEDILEQARTDKDKFVWNTIVSIEDLGRKRMLAMNKFLKDFEKGKQEGRYIEGSLPILEFRDKQFDLVLCSHYLFLYSEQVSLDEHFESIKELCRVAREVRIYPLVALDGEISAYLNSVLSELAGLNSSVFLVDVPYQFQKNATQMLVVQPKQ